MTARQRIARALRSQSHTYQQIADRLHTSRQRAHQLCSDGPVSPARSTPAATVTRIKRLIAAGQSYSEVCREFGIARKTVSKALHGGVIEN